MKKKLLTIALTMLLSLGALAQENEMYYKDFEPDTCQFLTRTDSLKLGIDNDNSFDMWISGYVQQGALLLNIYMMPGWEMCPSNENTILNSDTLEWMQNEAFSDHYIFTREYFQKKIGVRKQIGDVFLYGWIFTYCDYRIDPNIIGRKTYIDRFAFCTAPNYPLRWGQTSMTGIGENEETTAFATLHPNPTNGLVAIAGENLKAAEAFNALGQRVSTATATGQQLQIDLSGLPAGVYFVNITDSEGRKCVRKVVKE